MNKGYDGYSIRKHGVLLKEFDYRYSIKRDGTLYSWVAQHGFRTKPLEMTPYICSYGYHKVTLKKNDGTMIKTGIHRLLAAAYLGLDFEDKKMTVNHKNGDKLDNRLRNLELMTFGENTKHFIEKLKKPTIGYNPLERKRK